MGHAPDHGGRILLVRDSIAEGHVRYVVELETRDAVHRGDLRIAEADGSVALGEFDGEPPAWLVAAVAPLARTLWTGRQKDESLPWPRRLHRWRAPR
jgi:hypothetical protein